MSIRAEGFTLIEIMVVVVIMGILAALVIPKLMGRTDDARVTAAKQDIATLIQALKLYKLDNQRYPTPEQGLQVLVQKPSSAPRQPVGETAVISTSCPKTLGAIRINTCPRECMEKSTYFPVGRTGSPAE